MILLIILLGIQYGVIFTIITIDLFLDSKDRVFKSKKSLLLSFIPFYWVYVYGKEVIKYYKSL